ncbi:MAG: response regulator [Cyanobacteriota bacterium]|nr:response regulator [Cyanobacteriota bacterium]
MIATILPIDSPLNCLHFVTSVKMLNPGECPLASQNANAKKLLLIDPEDDLREVIQTSLELTTSWEIVTARSYTRGIALAEAQQPHAILLNVERLDVDRRAILTQLKTNPIARSIPVILMTERVRLADWWQLTQLGVAGAISKPFDCASLGRQIAVFLKWAI